MRRCRLAQPLQQTGDGAVLGGLGTGGFAERAAQHFTLRVS
ncbi:hypothetical protein [Synechococcus sp. GFB01]|nr:hypothetical protein [Synechococcus sp. GFB01]